MNRRSVMVSLVLGVGWLVPWLIAIHAGLALAVPPLVGAAFLELAATKQPRAVLAAALLAALGFGYALGHLWGAVASGVAAWAGWAAWDPAPRNGLLMRLALVLVALGALVIWFPAWWPILLVAIGVGVLGLLEGERPAGTARRRWWGLGVAVAVAASGIALLAYGLAPVALPHPPFHGPCYNRMCIGDYGTDAELGSGISRLRGRGHPRTPAGGLPFKRLPNPARHGAGATGVRDPLTYVIPAGIAIAAVGLWLRRRMLRDWEPTAESTPNTERAQIKQGETAADLDATPTLQYTRRIVHQQLRQASRRPHAARPGETVREWGRRVYGESVLSAVRLYEEVRYGGAADSADRASMVARRWPSRPFQWHRGPVRPDHMGRRRGP
jgi:hypothetical protein